MSLLMDALRKAEEAKKQAEQEQQSADTAKQPEEKPVESTLSPPEDESPAIDESPLADSPPVDEPEQNIPGEAVDASGPSDLKNNSTRNLSISSQRPFLTLKWILLTALPQKWQTLLEMKQNQ